MNATETRETAAQRYRRIAAEVREDAKLPSPMGSRSAWLNSCKRTANMYDAMADAAEMRAEQVAR